MIREREAGFLYIEVLAGLALMAFALLSVAPMFVLAARENAAASDLTFAATAAYDLAEELKTTPYVALSAGADQVNLRGVLFERVWTVDDDTPHAGMRSVTVSVTPSRQGGFGGARAATLTFVRVP